MRSIQLLAIATVTLVAALPTASPAQTETTPAIAREVYRQQLEGPPRPAPRIVTERTVPDPTISPATISPATISPATVVQERPVAVPATAVPATTIVAPEGTVATWSALFARYRYGFNDDGNVDDNWFYDFYETPSAPAAVATTVVKPVTESAPAYRTSWKYDAVSERGLFSW